MFIPDSGFRWFGSSDCPGYTIFCEIIQTKTISSKNSIPNFHNSSSTSFTTFKNQPLTLLSKPCSLHTAISPPKQRRKTEISKYRDSFNQHEPPTS